MMNVTAPIRTGRAFHLVDIENLLGGPTDDVDRLRAAWQCYKPLVRPGDAVVIGGSGFTFAHAAFVLPRSVRWVMRRGGPDAADLALLEDAYDATHVARRYEWLVMGSADAIFAGAAVEAKRRGMRVWSVRGRGLGTAIECVANVRSHLHVPAPVGQRRYALAA